MVNDVYVFGDSHWRVFFPFVNHGPPGILHEQDGIRTIDMVANELSGATMFGLLNPNSKNGARNRILGDLDRLGGVDNVGLVFGEVDARYHHDRYFNNNVLSMSRVYELVARYFKFIEDDLLLSGRVRNRVFVYHGFSYPKMEETTLQPSQPMGTESYLRAEIVNARVKTALCAISIPNVHLIINHNPIVSDDGVHLIPENVYPLVLRRIKTILDPIPKSTREISL